jgi:tight adherence protein B
MTTVIILFLIVFGSAMGIYFALTKRMKTAEVQKLQGRILGKDNTKKGAGTAAKPEAQLIQTGEARKGKVLLQLLDRSNLSGYLERLMEQAGQKVSLTSFINQTLLCAIALGGVAYVFLPSHLQLLTVVVAVIGACLPFANLVRLKGARLHKFEEVFPDTLEFIARSMRAGHAFSVSLEMIHREFPDPVGGEFKRTFEEHNLGLPLDAVLIKFGERIPSLDVHFFVSAVLLQKRTGGNLAEILDKLAFIMRERFKLRGKIRAISAHGKMTATSLSCIPIGVAVLMFFTNPTYVRFFFEDTIGNYMLAAAVCLQMSGYAIMQKIVNIEV